MAEVESEVQRMYAEALRTEAPSEAAISALAKDVLEEDLYLCGFSDSDVDTSEFTRKRQRVGLNAGDARTESTGAIPRE
jgi:hypothetical protein